jgi:hypothetical protein
MPTTNHDDDRPTVDLTRPELKQESRRFKIGGVIGFIVLLGLVLWWVVRLYSA